mgnify:CR=1 FL=1
MIIPADLSGLAGLVEGLRALNAQGEGPFGGGEEITFSPDGRTVYFTLREAGRIEPLSTSTCVGWPSSSTNWRLV